MIKLFAVTNRGLEAISAEEMRRVPGMQVTQVGYRRVSADYTGEMRPLLGLRTVDDVFIDLAAWEGVVPQRSALAHLARQAGTLKLAPALSLAAQVRPLAAAPAFSVTANFVGRRSYTADEIKEAVASGIRERYGWTYTTEDESQANLRLFIEHERAYVGLRLAAGALHRRLYKEANVPGSLKPTIAAAMLQVAGVLPGESLLDPFCGAGTILIEAALSGLYPFGGDHDPLALAAAEQNASSAGVSIAVEPWDARRLPLENRSVGLVVTNLPWGRQVEAGAGLADFYAQVCVELERVLTSNGLVVALTNLPDLLTFTQRREVSRTEISLFGQTPVIVKFAVN